MKYKRLGLFLLIIIIGMWTFLIVREVVAQTPPTTVSISGGTVRIGGTIRTDLRANTLPNGLVGFSITVSTADTSIARPVLFEGPDYGLTQVDQFTHALRLSVADLNGIIEPGAMDVLLGTVEFLGVSPGITPIIVTVDKIDDDNGDAVLTSGAAGLITVTQSLDLDGDGITEDVDGNGVFGFSDIVALFELLVR